jgi:hypothetical protein
VNNDGMLSSLTDRSQAAADFAKQFLLDHTGTGNDIKGNDKPYASSGFATVYAGSAATSFIGVPPGDPAQGQELG